MKKIRVLGVIPARAGSKGIKNKNIYLLGKKPLLAYSIKSVRESKLLTDCIISTDSPKIANIALKYKAKVPFLRPKKLARDNTCTEPVLRHALIEYEKISGQYFDYVMLLQPTVPFRKGKDIDAAIKLMLKYPKKNALVSCFNGMCVHPQVMYKEKNGKVVPFVPRKKELEGREHFEKVFVRDGSIYLTKRNQLLNNNKIVGKDPLIMVMPRWGSVNIDSHEDFRLAEMILHYRKIRLSWFN